MIFFKVETFEETNKKSHTFPTIAFIHFLKEQWELCDAVFNIKLRNTELAFFCVPVVYVEPPCLLVSVMWVSFLLGDAV